MSGAGVADPATSPPTTRRSHADVMGVLRVVLARYALVIVTIAIFVFFTVYSGTSETFPTAANLRNVVANQSVLVIAALASMFPLVCREFDFSVGAVATVSQIAVGSAAAEHHVPLALALLIGIGIGFLVGSINALIVTLVGVNGIVTTLGMSILLAGLVILYTGDQSIVNGIPEDLTSFGSDTVLGIPAVVLMTAAIAAAVGYVMTQTPVGRYLYSVGSNPAAARLVGLNVRKLVGSTFVVSGTLAGIAGAVILARNGIANPQIGGTTLTVQALSAVFLGATAIRPGQFNVLGTLFAVFFIAFTVSGLSLAGAADWVNDVFTGTALIVAVIISTYVGRKHAGQG
jgi:ribose transport system permease protein